MKSKSLTKYPTVARLRVTHPSQHKSRSASANLMGARDTDMGISLWVRAGRPATWVSGRSSSSAGRPAWQPLPVWCPEDDTPTQGGRSVEILDCTIRGFDCGSDDTGTVVRSIRLHSQLCRAQPAQQAKGGQGGARGETCRLRAYRTLIRGRPQVHPVRDRPLVNAETSMSRLRVRQ